MAALRGARNLFSQANHLRLLRVHPVALGDTSVNLKCVLEVFLAMRSSNQVAVVRSRISNLSRVKWICNLFAVRTDEEHAAIWEGPLLLRAE